MPETPGPGPDSGGDGGNGSTMMSKSETFHGPGGFLTPSDQTPPPNHTHTKYNSTVQTDRAKRGERETHRNIRHEVRDYTISYRRRERKKLNRN